MENPKEKELDFNYDKQVWTFDGIVLPCGHLPEMRANGDCCNAWKLQGTKI